MPSVLERFKNTKARTLLLLGLIILFVVGFVIYFFIGSSVPTTSQPTKAATIPTISAIPGGATSERYQQLQEEENKRRAQTAKQAGTSEVATIIGGRGKDATGKESFGIENLLNKECKCPAGEVIGGCPPDKTADLIAQIQGDMSKANALIKANPCLLKNLCSQYQNLAVEIMAKDQEIAKMLLNDCPQLAQPFAEKYPAEFKKLMLANPELARKLAAMNPELFKKLMLDDPEFARALAKSNPDLVRALMEGDPAFAAKFQGLLPKKVVAVAPSETKLSDQQKNQLQALVQAMENQAKSAFQAWNEFTAQQFVQGEWVKIIEEENKKKAVIVEQQAVAAAAAKAVLFKAGTVLFAVMDTTVSSDEPGPILATVVEGKYCGAKLLGTFTAAPQPGGLPAEKVILNFTSMNIPEAPASIPIQAVAIDPDTARTALATEVDHHYLLRYGTIFASAFLVGYAKVLTSQGSVQTTSANGLATTTTAAQLSGRQQVMAAFGEVGKKLGESWKLYANIPPTVIVDSGTGVGILFLSDVTGG